MHEYLLVESLLHRKEDPLTTILVERLEETIIRYYIFHFLRQNMLYHRS